MFAIETEWSEVSEQSAIFCMQGRRPGNEDRAVIKRVEMVEGIEQERDDVHIWAVMDGHGGNVCFN
jgi:serine/threonine protein phosphatase PrpC